LYFDYFLSYSIFDATWLNLLETSPTKLSHLSAHLLLPVVISNDLYETLS